MHTRTQVFEGAVWFWKINNSRNQFYEWATAEIKSLTFILKRMSRSSKVHKTVLFLSSFFFKKRRTWYVIRRIVKCGKENIILKQMTYVVS